MKYCLAIDIAKGKSAAGLFADGIPKPLIEPYYFRHTLEELDSLAGEAKKLAGEEVTVVMESTSVYHLPVERYFRDAGFDVIVINPIISKDHKRSLRKTKTDKEDCHNLASLFFQGRCNDQSVHEARYVEMQLMSRYIETQHKNLIRWKSKLRQLLTLTFPEFEEIYPDRHLFDETALTFISKFPHAGTVAKKRLDALMRALASPGWFKPERYRAKAEAIKGAAKKSLASVAPDSVAAHQVSELAREILRLEKLIDANKAKLIEMAASERIFQVCRSFYGISDLTAAYLAAELKDISRFSSPKKLIASCGLDPTIVQSGRSIDYHGPISKRGNRMARKHLFNIINGMIQLCPAHKELEEMGLYYRKKRSEGKHHYAAVTACCTKLLRKIYFRFNDPKSAA